MTEMERQAREFLAITRTGRPTDDERLQIYMLGAMAGMKLKELGGDDTPPTPKEGVA